MKHLFGQIAGHAGTEPTKVAASAFGGVQCPDKSVGTYRGAGPFPR